MVYYPMSVLMMAGIRDILIISTPTDRPNFERLLGDGSQFGANLSYAEQPSPDGLAQAFLIGEEFIAGEPCVLILGDNIFYGNGLSRHLRRAMENAEAGALSVVTLGHSYAWLDTGTMESLYEAGEFVRAAERAQDTPVAVLEEIAWENGWVGTDTQASAAGAYGKSVYGQHLRRMAEGKVVKPRDRYE